MRSAFRRRAPFAIRRGTSNDVIPTRAFGKAIPKLIGRYTPDRASASEPAAQLYFIWTRKCSQSATLWAFRIK